MRRRLTCGFLACLVPAVVLAADPTPSPKVPDDWRIELVAQAPDVLFPTAVVQAPDGTVYLGQDPMDMPGPPTQPIDSVVALRQGKVTVFADQLWSVMGLEWVDGTLYVVHAPYLSALRDTDGDGKADTREDLMTGLGPKLPGFSGINDHVPSGLRLGMDGFLYISVGDKGIPHGVGKDGATVRLQGGGVVRIRPDGTGLEVVSTGERNPLSVALTSRDDVFTYGNDDDSKKWPNSLTHHIVGGHYGYPYEFLTAPARCLPVVTGQIGGSGAQGVCYNEDGLPASYRGDFFFTDWGLQTVFRYHLKQAGGTFALVKRTPFVTRGTVPSFRPFSIAVSSDGAGFWLVDWAFDGWLADGPKTGRLYRLTYQGNEAKAPVPRPSGNDLAIRLAALDHPALSVRLEAQRILVRQGEPMVASLTARLQQAEPVTGRLHALWALDAIGTPTARNAIRAALLDPKEEVRLQAARSVGVREDRPSLALLSRMLRDPDAAVRRESAIALGKLGDPSAEAALMAALGERDPFASWSIRHALRRLNDWDEDALVAALLDDNRRDNALKLTDEAWAVPVVRALVKALAETRTPVVRARIVATLSGLYRQYPDWSGNWFGTNPLAGQPPRKTQDWDPEGMAEVLRGLTLAVRDADPDVRLQALVGLRAVGPPAAPVLVGRLTEEPNARNLALLVQVLGALRSGAAVPGLAALARDAGRPEEVRAAALDALGMVPSPGSLRARFALVYDKKAPAALVSRVLPGLGRAGTLPANDLAGFLDHPAPEVRAAALLALNPRRALPDHVQEKVRARLEDPAPEVRKAAIEAVAAHKLREAIPRLLVLARDDPARAEAILALSALPDPRAFSVYLAALGERAPEVRRAGESALLAIREQVVSELTTEARSGRLSGPAVLAVERILTRFTPITDWRVIGPFPRTTARVFLGEPSIDFNKTHAGVEGRPIAWNARRGDPQTGRVVLDDFKAGAGDRGGFGYDTNGSPDLCAFACTEIESDRDRPALLLVGSSGSLTIEVNQTTYPYNYGNFAGRAYAPDSDLVRFTLKKGKNRVLVSSRQGIGAWSFSLQLSEPSERLLTVKATGPSAFREFAQSHQGDSRKGEALFFDAKGVGCVKCHAANGRGTANVGPDLTGLALKYDKAEIIRSVLEPSNRIATGYQPVLIATKAGKVLTGLVRAETDAYVELIDAEAKITRVPKNAIDERRVGAVSVMPTGQVDTLTVVEFADLISFLEGLKTAPAQSQTSARH